MDSGPAPRPVASSSVRNKDAFTQLGTGGVRVRVGPPPTRLKPVHGVFSVSDQQDTHPPGGDLESLRRPAWAEPALGHYQHDRAVL